MNEQEHQERHKQLHNSLDELVADFIHCTKNLLSGTSIMVFLLWAGKQSMEVDHPDPGEEEEEKKTSIEWDRLCKIEVLDADGWDRKNYQFSMYEELISREEFEVRLSASTCSFPEGAFAEGYNMWRDKDGNDTG